MTSRTYIRTAFAQERGALLSSLSPLSGGRPLKTERPTDDTTKVDTDEVEAAMGPMEIDPESLREAEFMQAQMILDTMVGKAIVKAEITETRISIETGDGNTYFFYGFMGGSGRPS